MADITIDRLALDVPGLSPEEARRLAQAIAGELAAAPVAPEAAAAAAQRRRMELTVNAAPAAGVDWLARQIVAEMLRQLERSS